MQIPGLGCLKGCLFTIVILVVAAWLIWELTPLQDWIGSTKGFLAQIGDWIDKVSRDWVSSSAEPVARRRFRYGRLSAQSGRSRAFADQRAPLRRDSGATLGICRHLRVIPSGGKVPAPDAKLDG